MRNGDIVTPGRDAEDLLLDPARLLSEEILGRVGEDTQHELVKLFLVLGQVLVAVVRVVVVRLRTPRADRDADALLRALEDRGHFGVQADLDAARLELMLPLGVEFGFVREYLRGGDLREDPDSSLTSAKVEKVTHDHGWQVAGKALVVHGVPC